MMALVELVDEFGEAIESDLSQLHGDSLRDYLLGRRPPGEALRKIRMLPPGSATAAQMMAAPGRGNGGGKPEPWRAFHGVTRDTHAMWDLWDAIWATAPLGKGKKPPQHPRSKPPRTNRGRPNAARTTQ